MFRVRSWVHIVIKLIYTYHQEKVFDGKYSQYSKVLGKELSDRQHWTDTGGFHDKPKKTHTPER